MKWRAWKAAYETAVDEWQLEVERLQAVIARFGAERDEAVRISVGLIEGMHPIEREVALDVLHQRAADLREQAAAEPEIPERRTIRWDDDEH